MLASGEQVHRERFGAGLELLWLHAPHSLQAALALELDGGSHDEPAAYPGLAHFLEHMVFRGSRGYAVGDGLMSYVQQVGGSVNASTRGCRTLFHFQVTEQALLSACERLCDQLLEPLLDLALQRAEREVIDAEFHLRAGDPDTLIDAAVGTALDRAHGAAGFHAGNRDSLPVESAEFQQALQAYHQTVYRQAAARLVVVSAMPAEEGLRALRPLLQGVAQGRQSWRLAQPPFLGLNCSKALHLSINGSSLRHVLVVAVESQAQGASWLVELLKDNASENLSTQLLEAGIEARMRLRVLHAQGEQALLAFDFSLSPASWARRGVLRGTLVDWLRACQSHVLDEGWLAHVREAQNWQWPLCSALDKAQYLLERMDYAEPVYYASFAAWLASIEAGQCLEISVDSRAVSPRLLRGFELALEEESLPSTQPITLRLGTAPYPLDREWRTTLSPQLWSGMHVRPQWRDPAVAALFLHWVDAAPSPAGLRALQTLLLPLQREAERVGVRLDLCQCGAALNLQLLGNVAVMAGVLQQALPLLQAPWPEEMDEASPNDAGIALRHLLQALPGFLHPADGRQAGQLPGRSSGLLLCHDDALAGQVGAVCAAQALQVQAVVPGETSATATDRRWQHVTLPGGECALLLFVAAPEGVIGLAAWRLLGQCLPDAFQRQLRDEQQLGYALFCGYRQFDGCAGLLFAVQSARADAAAIWQELDSFFQAQVRRIAELTTAEWQVIGQHLRNQLQGAGSGLHDSAQTQYHAWLAGQVQAYPHALLAALDAFTPADLADWLEHLRTRSPQLVLSSAACPWG